MKPYTKASNAFTANNYKYPITSKETDNTYEVVIYPYGMNEERYLEGCIATLRKKKLIFSRNLLTRFLDNNEGKITITYINSPDEKTSYEYNLINISKLIVELYESGNKYKMNSINKLKSDFNEFSNWDGKV